MKRGKRTVAHYVKSECLMKAPGQPQLAALLNFFLDCNKSIDDYDTLDWCKWLISGGETFDEFAKTGIALRYHYLTVAVACIAVFFKQLIYLLG